MKTGSSFYTFLAIGTLFSTIFLSTTFASSFPDIGGREDTRAIEFLQERQVVQGYTDGTYQPERSISRAEFTKIVLETSEMEIKKCTKTDIKKVATVFSDISADEWFAEYVCRAYMSGVVEGYTDGTFRPHQEINLVEAAKIVTLTQESDINLSDTGEWFEKYMNALEKHRALNPNIIPQNDEPINRGVMADMVWRLQTGTEVYATAEPQTINSCVQLEEQIAKLQKRQNNGNVYRTFDGELETFGGVDAISMESLEDSMPMPLTTSVEQKSISADESGSASNDFSTTNIQEKGVDEADIIKNDGSHIFYARGENVKIIKAFPQDEMQEDATITVEGMYISNLMLEQDTLIVMGNRTYTAAVPYIKRMAFSSSMPYYGNGGIEVRIFDISDRSNPVQTRSVSLDGNLISTRRVGETLYIISNNYLYNYSIGNPLPMVKDANLEYSIAPECGNITYFPNFTNNNLMTVAAVDIQNPTTKISMENYLGSGQEIYASPENLYIIQPDSTQVFTDENGVARWRWKEISKISKFSIDGLDIDFVAQGEVNGRVLNQYSMSEYDENFRIATTSGWGNESENIVSILDEGLKVTGQIGKIAPGEQIKSVRFMGERGFVVTFKAVDPLFVIDMAPSNPTILGELKIPGWSDYLHPIDDDYLIGFGKEVNPESENNDRLTWDMLMGMKISIFDVSDLENPKEIHKTVIGDRGTESDVLHNPRALFYDSERQLVGFPIRIEEKKLSAEKCEITNDLQCSEGCVPTCKPSICDEESGICTSDCRIACVPEVQFEYDQFENTFTGAQLYSFDIEKGFELQGQVSHFPKNSDTLWDQTYTVERLIRIGENMYSASKGMVKGLDMNLNENIEVSFLGELACESINDQALCAERSDCSVDLRQPWCEPGKLCVQMMEFAGCSDK